MTRSVARCWSARQLHTRLDGPAQPGAQQDDSITQCAASASHVSRWGAQASTCLARSVERCWICFRARRPPCGPWARCGPSRTRRVFTDRPCWTMRSGGANDCPGLGLASKPKGVAQTFRNTARIDGSPMLVTALRRCAAHTPPWRACHMRLPPYLRKSKGRWVYRAMCARHASSQGSAAARRGEGAFLLLLLLWCCLSSVRNLRGDRGPTACKSPLQLDCASRASTNRA